MRAGRLMAVAVFGVAAAAWPALAYDEEHEVTHGKCELPTGTAKVRSVSDSSCDKHGSCEGTNVVTLTSARRKRLLRVEGAVDVTCLGTTVTLSVGTGADKVAVALAYSAAADRLTLGDVVMRELEQRWARPPAPVDPKRDTQIELYELITSFDKRPVLSATLLGAREALAAGNWATTDRYLYAAAERGAAKDASLAARQREIAGRLRTLREQPSLLLGEWRRIGRVLSEPVSPPDSEASWFWSGGKLCVQQDGDSPGTRAPFMRCYAPAARRWGERVALARGPVDEAPKVTWHDGANVCDLEKGWTIEGLNFGGAGICGYDFFADDLYLVAKGPVALASGGKSFQLIRPGAKRGEVQQEPPARATLRRMLAASPGSRLAADGDFFFDDESCTLYASADTRKTWLPLERNGKGQPWRPICPPLVAPNQGSLAVAARRGAKPGTDGDVIDLWLIQISGDGARGHD